MRSRFQIAKRKPAAARTSFDGFVFDSVAEMHHYEHLAFLERAGTIRNLRRQVKMPLVLPAHLPEPVSVRIRSTGFPNGRNCVYTCDFVYDENNSGFWNTVYDEYKGVDDPLSRLRRSVVEAIYGIKIRLSGPGANPKPKRKQR